MGELMWYALDLFVTVLFEFGVLYVAVAIVGFVCIVAVASHWKPW